MSVYVRNQPVAGDDLSVSQPFLVNNTNQADTSFGVDHYAFSDATANNGYHKKVTNPDQTTDPATTTAPILYGRQVTAPLGVLQFSRGPSNAVPSPVTMLQSSSTPIVLAAGASSNVLDFTGISLATFLFYFYDSVVGNKNITYGFWNGTTFSTSNLLSAVTNLGPAIVGNVLTIKNVSSPALNNVYWTLEFLRIQ